MGEGGVGVGVWVGAKTIQEMAAKVGRTQGITGRGDVWAWGCVGVSKCGRGDMWAWGCLGVGKCGRGDLWAWRFVGVETGVWKSWAWSKL